ncbi:Protein sip-5 [Ceratocystis lukuohia]|uniref:Protein sip-5 n=1 Tax=Ceratocystis lukuohia TaxID=2019550 RepID=A0ABR4MNG4_9PEZI
MGNTNGKESRDHQHGRHASAPDSSRDDSQSGVPSHSTSSRHRSRRGGRGHDSMLMFGIPVANSTEQQPFTHKETRAEREARKLEKERLLRAQERARSMQSERVDGGYLVTVGTYVGPEDFSKPVVRQLIIERRIAPFWRGLNDIDDSWTDAQLIAAVRGSPIPDVYASLPVDLLNPEAADAEAGTSDHTKWLTVPAGRLQPAISEQSQTQTRTSPTAASGSGFRPQSSHFRTRKSFAAAIGLGSSRNNSNPEISTPPETHLPVDPFVSGKPLEVCLYREATECPICFLSYPPFLNHTRCCDQPICSECFVQIKRPDPTLPANNPEQGDAPAPEGERPWMLVTKPTQCPYCQQPEFGVTYDPPPFRRGIVYETPVSNLGAAGMGSRTSVNSSGSPSTNTRRRAQSLSANDPLVVSSDKLRPEWEAKLSSLRAHEARRSAAATALHHAAFLRDGHARYRSSNPDESMVASSERAAHAFHRRIAPQDHISSSHSRSSNNNRSVTRSMARPTITDEEYDEEMLAQAMQLSILSEEQRKRKVEREAQKANEKDAKKREKEEKKKKRASFYPLSFGNHGSSSQEQSRAHSDSTATNSNAGSSKDMAATRQQIGNSNLEATLSSTSQSQPMTAQKGKGVDHSDTLSQGPSPGSGAQTSQIGQASSSSSPVSSVLDVYPSQGTADMRTSSTSIENQEGDDGNDHMLNFRSLAEIVGVDMEKNGGSKANHAGAITHNEHAAASSHLETDKNTVSTSTSEHGLNSTYTVSS